MRILYWILFIAIMATGAGFMLGDGWRFWLGLSIILLPALLLVAAALVSFLQEKKTVGRT